ncbi:pyrroline-5-carboxylate reductase [Akkermansiaceae bacterium]|nr:pyrroline-5-carboxylate reductase [Akkermansiaceae bacterium]MDB9925398.1 pyrroline-5-carboxylate reductase [bacterium]MDB4258179.1 pyrroline-5-carboxylate reductase [Akkermansiaceae bacterium]MDB4261806.1 pyrroline-5-carboxylate reductase [Akkermansiaceae bacterium]MDB4296420.1 pyrroline-5-carboxylate reductase [Akkermansiaceae bacterium]
MKVGLIGCGKMGQALALGALKAAALNPNDLFLYDSYAPARDDLAAQSKASACDDLASLIEQSEALLLCVKPADVADVLKEIPDSRELLVLSIAAGVTLSQMESQAGKATRVVRAMPNTPSLVGEGAAAFSLGSLATPDDADFTKALLGSVGSVHEVKEVLMDAVTGLSGSGPAYVFTFIEALADGALLEGLPREQALALATQTVLGAATMVRKTGALPADLRDKVTSPGGTTIAGLAALEAGAFRSTIISAVSSAARRSRELGTQ